MTMTIHTANVLRALVAYGGQRTTRVGAVLVRVEAAGTLPMTGETADALAELTRQMTRDRDAELTHAVKLADLERADLAAVELA